MPQIDFNGLDGLENAFKNIAELPDDVKAKALNKMGEEAAAKIKAKGEAMRIRDDESNTHILDKITVKKPKLTKDGGYTDVTFSGSRRRGNKTTRNAEIAFINEYGKRNQAPRPFIKNAVEESAEKILSQGADIIGDWLEKNFKK